MKNVQKKSIENESESTSRTIGTLKEKTLHAALKDYLEPDVDKQEIKIGRYHVDILNEQGIIEVQTQNFNLLRNKLEKLLPDYTVTVVYPITHDKWLYWVDNETGEVSKKRKSPKRGTYYIAFFELYKIKMLLNNPNLRIKLMMINMEEFRLLNGWSENRKRGSSRHDRVPVEIVEELILQDSRDYLKLIPNELDQTFTSKDYAKSSKLHISQAQTALNVLHYVGAVDRVGKEGNAYVYCRNKSLI
ncbi:hypothetical protein [Anaeromicropila populeti]|uniref:DUF8091 domain-containing protein n=1 Tax=Anaeromicropila populeti TaxID=37658 RepID=A0A1I6LM20_9FIRM|nr:hypothetical protein [Anaeromicropila populeti]SFS04524.1 hypothetical protein SAMN05661086_03395 [Anaeromicropila populeti]